ncbi:MAG: hypothetical protein LBR71_00050 [Synergistaceae bacterium]|jgi:hypothetical protein|nr:hypothetical protein [Synergistaceae bacterium]
MGCDGDYVDRDYLRIDKSEFFTANLEEPFSFGRRFDLVTSTEVAEHLPEIAARTFVDTLCNHCDLVFFTAALPEQRGVHHVNCQYPSYWAKLFRENGFSAFDFLKKEVIPRYFAENGSKFKLASFFITNGVLYAKRDSEVYRKITDKYAEISDLRELDALNGKIVETLLNNNHRMGFKSCVKSYLAATFPQAYDFLRRVKRKIQQ